MNDQWIASTLLEACVMYQPATITSKELVPDGPYPVYGANGVIGRYDRFNHEDPQLLVTCRGATCGSVNVSEPRSWITGNSMVIRPKTQAIDHRFLEYFFRGGVDLSRAITGAAQPQITRASLNPIAISYPASIQEQRRIVAILDEAFEAIATAKGNAEKNMQNARDLLREARQTAFSSLTLEHGAKTLGYCCDFENGDRGKNYPSIEHRTLSGVPFINAGHLSGGRVDLSEMDYISPERFAMLASGKIRPMDILFCLRGSLGKFACVHDLDQGAIASSLVILRPRALLSTGYLLEFLASPQCAEQINVHKGGAAQPNLGAKDLKLFELPVPSTDRQAAVVGPLSDLAVATSDLIALHGRQLAALDELKRSLLHQAFTGALTARSTDQQLAAAA